MSPRIIQAMEILQLTTPALLERLDSELQSNPVLEVEESTGESTEEVMDEPDRGELDMVVDEKGNNSEDFERLEILSREYGEDVAGESAPMVFRSRLSSGDPDQKMEAMANAPASENSLISSLHDQWLFMAEEGDIDRAGRLIIDSIDEDGYLRIDLDILGMEANPPVGPEVMNQALHLVQSLEPVGIGARNLRECLLLQLAKLSEDGLNVGLELQLVTSFLKEIEMNHLPQIARRVGRTLDEIKKALENIAHLDPHPGLTVSGTTAPAIRPDVIVELDDNGNVCVLVSDDYLPHLVISDYYVQQSRDRSQDVATRKFLRKNIRSGRWLIEAVEQRKHTLRRVTEEVFKVQRDFLDHGHQALRPLPMADIAEKVGVHVATVSRAVSDKYVQTDRGIFPIRMFFSGGTRTSEGQDISWEVVKLKLRQVVESEDKSKPLNDEKLVEALRAEGIDIARRTVAKYRGILDIPPARQRREY